MQRFRYVAVDGAGERIAGNEFSTDRPTLARRLESAGLILLTARASAPPSGSVPGRVRIDMFHHLSELISAGVPLLEGLRELCEDGTHPLAFEIESISHSLESGRGLSEAFAEFPKRFPPLVLAVVSAGELSGNLAEVLSDLADYFEWRENLTRQVRSALTYPLLVLTALGGLCAVLMFYVLPQFASLFRDLGVEIPLVLRILLGTQAFVSANAGWLAILGLAGSGGFVLWARTDFGLRTIDRAKLGAPLMGKLVQMIELSRYSHNLGLFVRSGLPIFDALERTTSIVQNRILRSTLADVGLRVSRGAGLADSMRDTGRIPVLLYSMLRVGESTGRLAEALERVSRYYDREVPDVIERAIAVFSASTIVALGVIVVAIALSFFVPIYEMYGQLASGG